MVKESLEEFVDRKYRRIATQPMLAPVIVCADGRVRGIGTWCYAIGGRVKRISKVLTAFHLFRSEGEVTWTAHPVANPHRVLFLQPPQCIPGLKCDDVVVCREAQNQLEASFIGMSHIVDNRPGGKTRRLKEERLIRSLLSGEEIALTGRLIRPDGEEGYTTDWIPERRYGESGTGYLARSGEFHVLLGGNQKRTVFSPSICFHHQL